MAKGKEVQRSESDFSIFSFCLSSEDGQDGMEGMEGDCQNNSDDDSNRDSKNKDQIQCQDHYQKQVEHMEVEKLLAESIIEDDQVSPAPSQPPSQPPSSPQKIINTIESIITTLVAATFNQEPRSMSLQVLSRGTGTRWVFE